MRLRTLFSGLLITCGFAQLQAMPVYLQADTSSPVIAQIEDVASAKAATTIQAPDGWTAINVQGPFKVYINDKQLNKSLEPDLAAAYHLQPDDESPILSLAAEGDSVEIVDIYRHFVEYKLTKTITGFVQSASPDTTVPATEPAAQDIPPVTETAAPLSMETVDTSGDTAVVAAPPAVKPVAKAQTVEGKKTDATLPRAFQGVLVSTQKPFRPRRPYDYALNDQQGRRYAYVDISKLVIDRPIETYFDHTVTVFGIARPMEGSNDFVIQVETLHIN